MGLIRLVRTGDYNPNPPEPDPDPEGPPTPADLFPELVALGGTTQIGYCDGSVRNSGGNAFGITGFGNWFVDNSNNPNGIAVDTSALAADNPTGSGAALLAKYLPNASPLCGVASMDGFPGGGRRVFDIGIVIKWLSNDSAPNSWSPGGKILYTGDETTGGPGPVDYWIERTSNGNIRFIPQGETPVIETSNAPLAALDVFHRIYFRLVGESEIGANDGEFHGWVNGVLFGSRNNINWKTALWNGMEWYAQINSIPSEQWQMIGGLWLATGD